MNISYFMKAFVFIIFQALLAIPGLAQSPGTFATNMSDEQPSLNEKDSLIAEREGLTTRFYQNGKRLSRAEIHQMYKHSPRSTKAIRLETPLKIVGGSISVGGIVLGVIALKGVPQSAEMDGKTYHYISRSKPQLIGGLALLAGGLCLFEWSNDLMTKSARMYNLRSEKKGKAGLSMQSIRISSRGVALSLSF